MPDIRLSAELRTERGSAPSRRMRAAGRVPAVVYGHGDAIAVSVDARELRHALSTEAGANVLFDLSIGGESHLAVARDLQRHVVRHTLAHVDFQVVRRDEVISAEVPIHLVGEALEVSRAGGTLDHALLSLHVRARPGDIPNAIEVDVSALEIGDSIRLGDIALPAAVTSEVDPETSVVVAQAPRSAEAPAEAGAETAPGSDAGDAASAS